MYHILTTQHSTEQHLLQLHSQTFHSVDFVCYMYPEIRMLTILPILLTSLQAPLSEKDLIVVGKSWFTPNIAARLNVGKVLAEIQTLGLLKPKRCGLTKIIAHFGRELIENKLVRVNKTARLTRDNVQKV